MRIFKKLVFLMALFSAEAFSQTYVKEVTANGEPNTGLNAVSILIEPVLKDCPTVRFIAGKGNIPDNAVGAAYINRIYAAATASMLTNKRVNVRVHGQPDCFGDSISILK